MNGYGRIILKDENVRMIEIDEHVKELRNFLLDSQNIHAQRPRNPKFTMPGFMLRKCPQHVA